MEKSVDALTEHELFVRDFLALYKQKPMLWQQNHPAYRNKAEKSKAYEALVQKSQEYYPEADEDFVRMKIESMRASFRKERKKVLRSKELCNNPEDVHKPSLWYYDLLLFTAGEEAESNHTSLPQIEDFEVKPEDGSPVKISFWSREHSAILINFYKSHPCLYSTAHPFYRNKRRRNDAVRKITDKLMATTGKYFHAEDVRRKISLIRGQFLYEYKKIKNSEGRGKVYTPTLWCFEMLSFLKGEYTNQKRLVKRRRANTTSDESDDDIDIKKESDSSTSSDVQQPDDEDVFDTIAKNLAYKLREMSDEQRSIANRLIRDVMYHGQMELLTHASRFSLDGT